MKTYQHITLCLIAIFASCSRIDTASNESLSTIEFCLSANMAEFDLDQVNTKATGSYIVKLSWEGGKDEISVINKTTGKILGGSLVAQESGSRTTFTGALSGTIRQGDQLLFIYPKKGNATEEIFSEHTISFQEQDGSGSGNVMFTAYAQSSAASSGSIMTISSVDVQFSFLMAYHQIALANLPENSKINNVTIAGIPSKLRIFLNNGNLMKESVYDLDDDGNLIPITLSPTNATSNANGDKTLFFTCPPTTATSEYDRTVAVNVNGAKYYDILRNSKYSEASNYRWILSNFTMGRETVLSFSAPFSYEFYGDEDTYEVPENMGLYEAGHHGWQRGDELSVVNLTTGELLQGTLWSEANGGITDFSGTVFGNKGLNDGDKLLLLYPKVGNESAMDFRTTPIIYDVLTEQEGTIESLPMIMAAKATYTNGNVSFSQLYPFQHLTSIIKLSATLDNDFREVEGGDIEVDGDGDEDTEYGDNEGFYDEGGAWDEGDYEDPFRIEDFTPDFMEVRHVPTKLMISYAGDEDYKLATINDGEDIIFVNNSEAGVTVEDNMASPFFVSIPAAVGDAWGSYTSIAASYYNPDGNKYMTYDYQWNLRMQTYYEIDIPLPYETDDLDDAVEGDEETNI